MSKRAIVIANGVISDQNWAAAYLTPEDYIIAADGGSRFLQTLGRWPAAIIGDLDSSDGDYLDQLTKQGVTFYRSPRKKNETDLELAINHVLAKGFGLIRILGGLGGRVDHLFGNISLLLREDLAEVDIKLVDAGQEVFFIGMPNSIIEGEKGDLVSLLSWGTDVNNVRTHGLEYPLLGETLFANRTRGISNVMNSKQAVVWKGSGALLCVHQSSKEDIY